MTSLELAHIAFADTKQAGHLDRADLVGFHVAGDIIDAHGCGGLLTANQKASEKFTDSLTTGIWGGVTMPPMSKPPANPSDYQVFLAEWAEVFGKKQKDIVNDVGLSKGYVSQLWNGRYDKKLSQTKLHRIAAYFGIHAAALLVHPKSPEGRAFLAMGRIPKSKQDTALEMLEGLADRNRT